MRLVVQLGEERDHATATNFGGRGESSTASGLAFTCTSGAVLYSAVGGLFAVVVGCMLLLRGRRRKGAHGK